MCSSTTGRASWPGRMRIASPDPPPTPAPASARWSTRLSPPSRLARQVQDQEGAVLRRLPMEDAEHRGGRQRLSRPTRSKIPSCSPSNGCGFNGLFSNYGTYPRWSPYKADVVQEGHHLRAEQCVAEQHLHRGLAFHGGGDRTRGHLGRVAIRALRSGRRQQHELIADMLKTSTGIFRLRPA